ncbi:MULTISPECIES: hypothetical protein [Vibrio]|uniref:Uncharacterized protein n=2 Tax=Vibrio TaxID=662 RepID=A0A510IFA2_9VIBR|nr:MULTISPECIES: hypothetical protein [Vibrio]RTZ20305.1 hypothetical protein EKN09_24485 [Vibrio penaeicida]BBL92227.1 hypothetical protein VroAM7_48800 [Vibrio rotiferianus]GLQ71159.1 hypothetical protein GCM10007932_05190 [Vibrio penaeicida]
MKFLETINMLRQKLPYPFYMLLVVVPVGVLSLTKVALGAMDKQWEWNIHFFSIVAFLVGINLLFWVKCHFQRQNQFDKARKAVWVFDAVFISYSLLLFLLPT